MNYWSYPLFGDTFFIFIINSLDLIRLYYQDCDYEKEQDFDNTNISVYFDAFRRAEIRGNEDPKWLAQDARVSPGLGKFDGTAWDDGSWRNTNAASQFGIWHGGGNRYIHTRPNNGGCAYTGTG